MKNNISFILFGFCLWAVSSCSNTKFLQDGQRLYTGANLKIKNDSLTKKQKSQLKSQLESNIVPKPNSSFLGLRPKLYIYNITKEPKKDKGLRHWLKYKIGEKPVLLSDVNLDFNKKIIENHSENKGYFNADATYDTLIKNKKASVEYTVKPGNQYLINEVIFPSDSSLISKEIKKTAPKSLLKKGNPFDLDVIIAERNRIDNQLKENGFYYFHPDNILVRADSTLAKNRVNLNLVLKDNTPEQAKEQFTINRVIVFADYNLQTQGDYRTIINRDSTLLKPYKDIYIVDSENKFKPRMFDRTLYFHKGELYNRADQNLSLNRLINLGTFKFVRNQFVPSAEIPNAFDAVYLLTPREFKSIRFEVLGKTNSANYAGGEVSLNWTHRNLLKGAEQFNLSIHGGTDVQMGGAKDGNNIYRLGFSSSLYFPRIIAPFPFHSSSAFVPRTKISLSYEFQNRTQLYTLHNLNGSFGYQWRENAQKEHELKLIDITYVSPQRITDLYREEMRNNLALQRVVEKQLIFGPTYSYTFTNTMLQKKHTFYYNGMVDLSANLTGLLSGADVKKGKQKEIFGIPYSQYAKMEHDFRYYMKTGNKSSLATRLIAGIAYPYGNSEFIPFSKQFFAGGSNSIRAFRARTLGPGSYDPRNDTSSFLHDQAGDIKLEMNLEYRAHLYGFLNGALFVDAGNVWLINNNESKPGGQFSKQFLQEVAIGAGLGLRFDFNILILRTDLAIPIRVPYYNENERWRFKEINFGSSSWRKNNLMLNIAIGYPF
ncbi:MAG: BamA/TamA family outer membrane protein [Cruoricaptor ignavus]|nr:BamA/TamA family outer membrane protein [Cruoricaptor ignavus]